MALACCEGWSQSAGQMSINGIVGRGWVHRRVQIMSTTDGRHLASFSVSPIDASSGKFVTYNEDLISVFEKSVLGGILLNVDANLSYRVYEQSRSVGEYAAVEILLEIRGDISPPIHHNDNH